MHPIVRIFLLAAVPAVGLGLVGEYVYAVNPQDGTLISKYHVGGRFGIVNPVIVGGTIYRTNSWDWIHALPLSKVDPAARI